MLKRLPNIILLFLLLFATIELNAANTEVAEIAEIDSLLDQSFYFMRTVDIKASLEHALEALSLSKSADYSLGTIRSCYSIGQALFHTGNYTESLKYLSQADKLKKKSEFPLYMCQIHKVRGQIYSNLELQHQAINEFSKSLSYADKIKTENHKDYLTSQIYESLSFFYGNLDKTDSAFHYMMKNKELLESMEESFVYSNLVNLYNLLGNHHNNQNNFTQAENYLNRALELTDKYDFPYTSRTYLFLGDMEAKKGMPQAALRHYFKAQENLEETNIRGEFPFLLEKILKVYEEQGITDSAKIYKEKLILIENELSKEKISSTEHVLEVLIGEEKKANRRKIFTVLSAAGITGLFVIILIIANRQHWIRKHKKLLKKKETENMLLKQKLDDTAGEVVELAKSNSPVFAARFQEVYPEFSQKLMQEHPNLSNAEFELCAMTFLNIPTKKIAEYTFIQYRSVQTKRSRLRKKMQLSPETDLYKYLRLIS